MPAEWEPHEATWLAWPKNQESFPRQILPKVEKIYIEIMDALHKREKVHLLVDDEKTESRVQRMLNEIGVKKNILIHQIKTADVWIRDYGPIFVKDNNKLKITKWTYNAYGQKYDELMEDDKVVDRILPILGKIEVIKPNMILEGGSIEVNGKGTMLTTEQCLLNKNRNNKLNRKEIEQKLKDNLGLTDIIWLKEGIAGDDTDGHIDDIARFVDERTVLCIREDNKTNTNYQALKKNWDILLNSKDQDGEKLEMKELPMPGTVSGPMGQLPASYANFYIGNEIVLLPVFEHDNDEKAILILEECFPKRKIVPIYCEPLVWGMGSIHCITQQQPK